MNNILKAIDAAYEKASTGVAFWAHEQDREGVTGIVSEDTICQFAYLREEDHAHIPYDDAEANAQLITLLVNHYPELKAEIERLREALKKIESTPLNADLYEGDGGPDDLGQAEWEDGQDYGTMLAADIARTALATPQDDGLDADHLLIDLLFIAGTMDANYRWLEESFNAHLDEPTDIEMMKEARRRFKYWKDLQASIYEQHQIEKMQREKYEKGQTLQDDGLRERVAELIDREYGSFTCSMPNKEARELALEVTDMLLALLPDGAGWRPLTKKAVDKLHIDGRPFFASITVHNRATGYRWVEVHCLELRERDNDDGTIYLEAGLYGMDGDESGWSLWDYEHFVPFDLPERPAPTPPEASGEG